MNDPTNTAFTRVATKHQDIIELSMVGPYLLGDSSAIEKFDDLKRMGFNKSHFKSHFLCDIWGKIEEWMDQDSFTPEKIISYCNTHYLMESAILWVAECSMLGSSLFLVDNALEIMERDLRQRTDQAIASGLKAGSSKEIMDDLEARIQILRSESKHLDENEFQAGMSELSEHLSSLEKGHKRLKQSGVPAFDRCIGGLPDSQLITVAGRPGGGKTALCEQIMDLALSRGESVLYVQRELSRKRAISRLVCKRANVPHWKLERECLSKEELQRMGLHMELYRESRLFLCPVTTCNAITLPPIIKAHCKNHEVSLVVIDYVQLLDCPKKVDLRVAIGDLMRVLKRQANETRATIITIAQLNRTTDKTYVRPTMADLKDCGNIEQESDVILALWTKYSEEEPIYPVNWTLLKNRNGGLGSSEIMFDGPNMKHLGQCAH